MASRLSWATSALRPEVRVALPLRELRLAVAIAAFFQENGYIRGREPEQIEVSAGNLAEPTRLDAGA